MSVFKHHVFSDLWILSFEIYLSFEFCYLLFTLRITQPEQYNIAYDPGKERSQ